MVGLEAMHGGADDPAQVLWRRRLETLRAAPLECRVSAMLGLRIVRQRFRMQSVTEPLEVGGRGGPKP
jgi:hypothetical protein